MTNVVLKMSVQRMVCTSCGSEANASCNCGVPYKPKALRAAEAIKANPEKSDRAIAAELGIDHKTVGKVRGDNSPPERVGRDGKTYSIKRRDEEGGTSPCDEEYHDDEDDITYAPREAARMAKSSFLLRVEEVKRYAFFPPDQKVDQEIIREAEAARDAWGNLVAHLKKVRSCAKRDARVKPKVPPLSSPDESWPDIHDHESQLADAGILVEDAGDWAT
jgi:hypothetical protein